MITLDLKKSDARNAADMVEMYFFKNIQDLLEIGELDNIEYLRSMIKVYDELNKAAEGEPKNNED